MKLEMTKALPYLLGHEWYGDAMWRMYEFEQDTHRQDSRETVEEAVRYSSDAWVIRDRQAHEDKGD